MRPALNRVLRTPEKEAVVLDDVIQQIDQSLPLIHKMAEKGASADTPASRLSKAQFKRAQIAFQNMKDDPLLNENGDDICLKKKKKKTAKRRGKINGSHS